MNATRFRISSTIATVAAGVVLLLASGPAEAHCDSVDGPVAVDVKASLASGDAVPVLKWVGEKQEAEVREAFQRALVVRKLGTDARALADSSFLETVVRLHREMEGEPYTGLKPAGNQPPFIAKVDTALEAGSIDDFAKLVGEHAASGVKVRFQKAWEAKKNAGGTVAGGRAYVAAYVDLMHYVEKVVEAVHAEGHAHGPASSPVPSTPHSH